MAVKTSMLTPSVTPPKLFQTVPPSEDQVLKYEPTGSILVRSTCYTGGLSSQSAIIISIKILKAH